MKEKDLKFIKQFTSISVKNVCSDLKINYSNVLNGNASEKTTHKVRKEIERRLKRLKEVKK
jgi:hypothetical protein